MALRKKAPASTARFVLRPVVGGRNGNTGVTVFFTGLSGSGKSTIANALRAEFLRAGARTTTLLDGDAVRRQLSPRLGFSKEDRDLNILRMGWIAAEIVKYSGIVICAPIAPYDEARKQVRAMVQRHGAFVLVYVATPLCVCEARDPKGLYAKARTGALPNFTGISDPYEPPQDAEIVIDTTRLTAQEAARKIFVCLESYGYVGNNGRTYFKTTGSGVGASAWAPELQPGGRSFSSDMKTVPKLGPSGPEVKSAPSRPLNRRLLQAMRLIDSRLGDPQLSVTFLARGLKMSHSRLRQLFVEELRMSPKSYIRERRLSCAAALLATARLSVKEAMVASGFNDPSHFAKDYKRRFGSLPSASREHLDVTKA